MIKDEETASTAEEQSRKAVEHVALHSAPSGTSDPDMKRLLHKLQASLAELQLQNEELKRRQGELDSERLMQQARTRLIEFSLTHSFDELLEETLNEVEVLTGSLISFYHLIDPDRNALTFQSWSTRTKRDFCSADGKGAHFEIAKAGVWAECVHQGGPVIHNDYASLAHRKGVPPGHAQVVRELVVPVKRGERIVAVMGVGNSPNNYDEEAVRIVSLFADLVWDNIERKRAEEDSLKAAGRLKLALNTAKAGTWEWDLRTNEHVWSDEMWHLHGLPAGTCNVSYDSWLQFIHPDDRDFVESMVQSATRSGEVLNVEWRLNNAAGPECWLMFQGQPECDRDGTVVRYHGIAVDISESKKTEIDLRESERKYRLLFQNMTTGFALHEIILDGNGYPSDYRFLEINPVFETLTGRRALDLLGKRCLEVMPATEPYWFEAYGHVALTGRSITFENYSMDLNRYYQVSAYSPEPGKFATVFLDITDRKQAEMALKKSEENLKLALRSARAGTWAWEMENDRVEWSRELFALFGLDPERNAASMERWQQILHPDDMASAVASLESAVTNNLPLNYDYRVVLPDGEVRWINMLGRTIYSPAGEPLRMDGICFDISERKHSEEEKSRLELQLQQAQKLESVGRLAGGVAHDFNNMLTVIIGYSELALMKIDPAEHLFTSLQEIRAAADRSANLTRQLLAFARKQTVEPIVLDVNETVSGMLSMLQRLIGENIELCWQPQSGLWPVRIDPSQIDQILANLCVNARDAIGDVGRISIRTEWRTVDETYAAYHPDFAPGDYVKLEVSDNGRGMDKETAAHIFEPFFTTKDVGQGTGLGLATVYGIVRQNDGFINVYSEAGLGTTFTIYIPRYRGKDGNAHADEGMKPHQGHETILLVEDDPAILGLTAEMLQLYGYTVLAANSPGEAISIAREYPGDIQLLMTDVVMPEMNGRELAKNLLSLYPKLRRLFMSGYTADIIAHHGVIDEGVHFIQKPFAAPELSAKVRAVLEYDQ